MTNRAKLHALTVRNKAFGKLNNSVVYMTDDLFRELSRRRSRSGRPLLEVFQGGMLIRGFKHLLERIATEDPAARVVMTLGPTRRQGGRYFINFKEYRTKGQQRFLSFYRDIGLDVSHSYLSSHFPDEFLPSEHGLLPSQLARVQHDFPDVIDKLTRKLKQKRALLRKTSTIVESLREEEKTLGRAMEELELLRAQSTVSVYTEKLAELRLRLGKDYPETRGKNSWQSWLYANNWMFGVQYCEPIPKEQVGFSNIPDFLFPTLDGFLDVLEIKKPSHEVLRPDSSHPESYAWSGEVNRAIGQVVNYVHQIDTRQFEIHRRINRRYSAHFGRPLYVIRPRATILIGTSDDWHDDKKEAFRKLNYALHGIEVLTYTDLLRRGESLMALYTAKLK